MSDLVKKLTELGHNCTVVATQSKVDFGLINNDIKVFSLKNPFKRSKKKYFRLFFEIIFPIILGIVLLFNRRSFDITISYSPSIFWVLLTSIIGKKKSGLHYLIVRDLFPLWVAEMNLISKTGFSFRFLNFFAALQFSKVDKIFVQSLADVHLIKDEYGVRDTKIALLENWYEEPNEHEQQDKIIVNKEKINILMLGNFGLAQNRDFLIDVLSECLIRSPRLCVYMIGLKIEDINYAEKKLQRFFKSRQIISLPSLSHSDAMDLARNCNLGLVSLAPLNTPGNVPGKFCAYAMAGLPTFCVAPELFEVSQKVMKYSLGKLGDCTDASICSEKLLQTTKIEFNRENIKDYGKRTFSTNSAANKILKG
jgi:glycosyltransferase involved in cell wall biosynthesis